MSLFVGFLLFFAIFNVYVVFVYVLSVLRVAISTMPTRSSYGPSDDYFYAIAAAGIGVMIVLLSLAYPKSFIQFSFPRTFFVLKTVVV